MERYQSSRTMWQKRLITIKRLMHASTLLASLWFLLAILGEAQVRPKRVLVLYEDGTERPGVGLVDQGLRAELDTSHARLEVYREYMETVLFPDPSDQKRIREFYLHKYKDRRPDVIITIGPSPLKFMVETHRRDFPGVPIVFAVAHSVPSTLALDSDFTGVLTELAPLRTIQAALRLKPDTKHIIVVGGMSYADTQLEFLVKGALKSYESSLDISYLTTLTMPDLLERLHHLPSHTILLYTSFELDAQGAKFISGSEAVSMITAAANAPVFTLYDVCLNHGEIGGKLFSARDQGRIAGELALRILKGEKPQETLSVNADPIPMFDSQALKRWGMKEKDLPPGSIVLNRRPGFWELYGMYVFVGIAVVLAQAVAILGLLWQMARRRKTESDLRRSEQKFSKVFRQSPLGITIARATDGRYLDVNEAFELQTGRNRDEIIGRTPIEINLWVNPDKRAAFMKQMLEVGSAKNLEVRLRRKDGQIRTSLGSAEMIEVNAEPCVLSVIADITERKQAEEALASVSHKMIEAQEKERTRIARELHDNINQRIALLAVEFEQLQQSDSGLIEARRKMTDLLQHITEIGLEVQAISHRLHSSKLEILGVVAACRSFCREVGERHHVIVDFAAEGIPRVLPQDIGLCVFRILQESLNNAIKHSSAQHFDVRLRVISEEIQLTVHDFGLGFDVPAALSGKGLGLISMRERASLVKGTISITSKYLAGTEIILRAPIAANRESQAISGAA
jgi:PAS domain S-box-containing protein